MSHDLEELFTGLRADLANTSLTEPSEIRRLGIRRDRVRNLAGGCAAAMVVVAALGTGVTLAHRPTAPPVSSRPSASATAESTPTPSPTPDPTPSTTQPSASRSGLPQGGPSRTASSRTLNTPCQPADLNLQTIMTGAAAGTTGHTVVVRNRSTTPCRLSGYPVLEYTRSGGGVAKIPVTKLGTQASFELASGAQASFIVFHVNGYGGYDPSDPACAHPVTYSGISVRFTDGQRFALPGLTLDVQCDGVKLQPWQAGVA